ncbi:MAG: radical SAM protein [Proteobacteria bacterium]|nr:radical SAM protein [Pseudomonadota bacterium]
MSNVEIGPIRPPSESRSLLIRLSRNCPWNRCLFCPVYKGENFSLRKKEDILREIDYLKEIFHSIKELLKKRSLYELSQEIESYFEFSRIEDVRRLLHWIYHNEFTVFLQDADPLFRKKEELIEIIGYLKSSFPEIKRITTYGRGSTIAKYSLDELIKLKEAGLNRVHTGLESGSDEVLDLVCKGVKSEDIIIAGKKLKTAGIEYSLYFMPGLGGRRLSKKHVAETLYVINNAEPDFVRLRTLGLNEGIPLFELVKDGSFEVQSEEELVSEIKSLIEGININTCLTSDHSLNLLMEINGRLPQDKESMLKKIDKFLNLPAETRLKFILARRHYEVFELNEFLSFKNYKTDFEYEKIKCLSEQERDLLFLSLRSQNL